MFVHTNMYSILFLFCISSLVSAFCPLASSEQSFRNGVHHGEQPKPSTSTTSRLLSSTTRVNGDTAPPMFTSLNQTAMQVPPSSTLLEHNVGTAPESAASLIPTPQQQQRNNKTAIVLNVNARSVTADLCEIANKVFGENHVFLTSTEEEAQHAAATIVQQHYSVVVPVGGDGTLSTLLNIMVKNIMNSSSDGISVEEAMAELPLVGYIPLGTGNGVGSVVACQPIQRSSSLKRFLLPGAKRKRNENLQLVFEKIHQVAQDTSHAQDDFEVIELPMIQVDYLEEQELCFFAGVGFDSLMLNDFKELKQWSQRTGMFQRTLGSVTGYCVALMIKTLPKCVFRGLHNINVTVTTDAPEETTWIDHRRGDVMRRVVCGNLYQGTTGILAAGTSPFYGGGLRLFPFARMTLDKMHLRLGRIHPLTGFFNIPKIFEGSYRDTSDKFGCIDFVGTQFSVEVEGDEDEGFPFQHSGESVGHAKRFQFKVVKEPVKFISFMQKNWKQ